MKAIVCTRYGPPEVLMYQEVATPEPKDDGIVVKTHTTTVTAGDCEIRSSRVQPWLWLPIRLWVGLVKPRGKAILGTEFAGEVDVVGKDVTAFKKGDRVFGSTGFNFGTNAEYVQVPEQGDLAIMPPEMSYAEAVALPFGGRDALHFLRKGKADKGDRILIIGAGGSIGTFAVQLAKSLGAFVTAVDSTSKLEMLRSIGADRVVDYTRENIFDTGESFDIIFDTVGKTPFWRSLRSLTKNGRYLLANPSLSRMLAAPWVSMSGKKVVAAAAEGTKADLEYLRGLAAKGVIKPVIDRQFPLQEIVEAHRYIETGQKKGNVIVTVG